MTATKLTRQTLPPDFRPGASYDREGVTMVEIAPGQFVNEVVALSHGIYPRKDKADAGRQ